MSRYTDSATAAVPDTAHAWASDADRFLDDQLLRRHGFTIVARPKGQEPVWQLGDRLYGQAEALRSVGRVAA